MTGKQITLLCLGLREAERSHENRVEWMSWRRGKHPTGAVSEKAVSAQAHLLRLRPAAPTLQCEASHLSRTRPSHLKTHGSRILTLPHQLLFLVFSRVFFSIFYMCLFECISMCLPVPTEARRGYQILLELELQGL